MTISTTTVWRLSERMADAMGAPTLVVVNDGAPYAYRSVAGEAELSALGRIGELRLSAGGTTLEDGRLSNDGSPTMGFDFPIGRAGYAGLTGGMEAVEPYAPMLDECVAWLMTQGKRRRGWVPMILVGAPLAFLFLLAGLVAVVGVAIRSPWPALGAPFVLVAGVATMAGLVVGTRNLLARERTRTRAVRVCPSP
jgi:hypothetical protein